MGLASGTKLGPYEIQSSLGAGGMGAVYRARDLRLERDVAIKVLPANLASDPALRQRPEREAKAISKLSHPNICALHDIGQQDGIVFLVMELVEGETLEQRLHKGPLSLEQTISYGAQIADALSKAHKRLHPSRSQAFEHHAYEDRSKAARLRTCQTVCRSTTFKHFDPCDGRAVETDRGRHAGRHFPLHGAGTT